jgi:mannose-6-phosphate isomerase-like protein (cupin superfamily)
MKRIVLLSVVVAVIALSQRTAPGQSGPKEVVDIKDAQVKAVLKYAPPAVDQTLRVVDMGKYQLSVAIIHRGPTAAPTSGSTGAAAAANVEKCGPTSAPPGAKLSPPGMIEHDHTAETYIVVSGGGTLVTGGEIFNGNRSGPESDVTKFLNGPSCSGRAAGNIVSRSMSVGDITIIPAGVPHGWTDITDHVDYLSVRPDPDKVLQHDYVNPHLAEAK